MEESGWTVATNGNESKQNENQDLCRIRNRIDELDQVMSHLLSQRLTLARELGQLKEKLGLPVENAKREEEVLSKVTASAADAETVEAIEKVYQTIFAQSKVLQSTGESTDSLDPAADGTPIYFPRVLIIGLGLIGGALARQIRKRIPQTIILGTDRPEVLQQALAEKVIDAGDPDLFGLLAKASLIVLSAPPQANLQILQQIAPHLRRRQIIVDVTSSKSTICKLAKQLNLQGADFIGGHPFFGSEKSGFANCTEVQPEGKLFCLVPGDNTSEISLHRLRRWLTTLKFRVELTDATTHDAAAARLSHLVQLLAVALGASIARGRATSDITQMLKISGPSFAQIARLMSSPPDMWADIVEQNREEIVGTLQDFSSELELLKQAIESGDRQLLARIFKAAADVALTLKTLS